MGTQRPTPTLVSLPQEILAQILDRIAPTQIAAYAQSCHAAHRSASDPLIWASAARRHLAVAPSPPHAMSPAHVHELAQSLVCRWWLVTGALVPDVATHFRKGFTDVRARGGVDLPLRADADDTCYVLGAHHERVVPASVPSLCMDFSLDAAGPFPNAGMTIRLIHAAEPREPVPPAYVSPPPTLVGLPAAAADAALTATMADLSLGPAHFLHAPPPAPDAVPPAPSAARVTVKVNDATVLQCAVRASNDFTVAHIDLPPDVLRTKPRLNTLVVEYDRASTAAYWLKEVLLTPTILPQPPVAPSALVFRTPPPPAAAQAPLTPTPPPRRPSPRRVPHTASPRHHAPKHSRHAAPGSHTAPRRAARILATPQPRAQHEETPMARAARAGKHLKQGKMQKHLYHHNHFRSPRGMAPPSPGAGRAAR